MLSRPPLFTLARALLPRLGYAPLIARGLWRKHLGVRRDLNRTDGRASKPPLQISLRITNRCNQRCAICGQFGEKGYMNTGRQNQLLEELPVETYMRVVDEFASYRPVYYITGGEAFLYKGLMDLTAYMKSKGAYVYVITNGTLLQAHAQAILDQQWDMLTCSFDGPQAVHDRCRGVPGTFQKTIAGISTFLDLKRQLKQKKPLFLLCGTISQSNQDHLEEMFETAAQIRPDFLVLYLSWFTTEEAGRRHAAILKNDLGVDAQTWKSYLGQNTGIDAQKVKTSLEKMRQKRLPFPWFHIPSIPMEQIPAYYADPADPLGYGPCVAPYWMVDIMPNGDVTTCRDYIDVKVGNIKEKPLLEIWNDAPFRAFRQTLQKHNGLLPQCTRCCGLMGF